MLMYQNADDNNNSVQLYFLNHVKSRTTTERERERERETLEGSKTLLSGLTEWAGSTGPKCFFFLHIWNFSILYFSESYTSRF